MKTKSLLVISVVLVLMAVILGACQPAPAAAPTAAPAAEKPTEEKPAAEPKKMKVAILLPGSANDKSWNQLGYDGLMSIEKELGAEVAYSENVGNVDAPDAIRDYAEKGFTVIIGHSGSYEEAMVTLGPEYPDTHFVIIAGSKGGGANVTAVDTAPWQVGFAEGWLAGKLTKTNSVAFITAGEGMQVMNNFAGAWKDGVKAANPDAKLCLVYLTDWGDVAAAREAALAVAANGADVVEHELNAATEGVLDVSKEKGFLTNARQQDQIDASPDTVIAGVDYDWNQRFPAVVKKIAKGELPGGAFFFGYNTPGEGFKFFYGDKEFNPKLVDQAMLDAFQKEVVATAKAQATYTVEQAKGGCNK